jgi:hypothetical protein
MKRIFHIAGNIREMVGYFHLDLPINGIIHMEVGDPPVR